MRGNQAPLWLKNSVKLYIVEVDWEISFVKEESSEENEKLCKKQRNKCVATVKKVFEIISTK